MSPRYLARCSRSPGRTKWPSLREAAALLVGGLQTRAWLVQRNPGARWTGAVRLGALLLLGQLAATAVTTPILSTIGLLGLLAVLRASYRFALVLILLPSVE